MQVELKLIGEFHEHQGGIMGIGVHQDGRVFFARSDEMVILFDLVEKRKIIGLYDSAGFDGAMFSPEGRMLISMTGESLHYWDLLSLEERMIIPGEIKEARDRDVHPMGRYYADGTNEGAIEFRKVGSDPYDSPDFTLGGHANYVECVRFHPKGKILASGSGDMTLRFWDLEARKEISVHKVHDDSVTAISFSPDGSVLVTGDYAGVVKMWEFKVIP